MPLLSSFRLLRLFVQLSWGRFQDNPLDLVQTVRKEHALRWQIQKENIYRMVTPEWNILCACIDHTLFENNEIETHKMRIKWDFDKWSREARCSCSSRFDEFNKVFAALSSLHIKILKKWQLEPSPKNKLSVQPRW